MQTAKLELWYLTKQAPISISMEQDMLYVTSLTDQL